MAELVYIRAALQGDVAKLIQETWQSLAAEHSATGFYASDEAFVTEFPYQGQDTAVAVMNTSKYARTLELGHPGYHLPSVINWPTKRAKMSNDGRWYVTIPFRHTTPGSDAGGISSARRRTAMPDAVYRDALRALKGEGETRRRMNETELLRARRADLSPADRVRQAGTRMSRTYSFPGVPTALRQRALEQEGRPGYTWRARTYEGLRYSEQTNPETGRSSGQFHTFRTLTEDSVGWYIPAQPGYGFARRTVELVAPRVRELVGEAARQDVVQLIQVEVGR